MAISVYIDGVISGAESAKVSVFDRGFLYGDSVYEVMRTAKGKPVDEGPHLDRLERSAASLALALPPREQIAGAVRETLRAAANDESYVRIVVTRGAGAIGLDTALADVASLIVIVRPLELLSEAAYRDGVALRIVGIQRTSKRSMDPAVKSGNYLNNILALQEAKRAGAYEALMCDASGRIAEGASSNVFVVRDGVIVTPALDIGLLAGITRERVIELARAAGYTVEEGALVPNDLLAADEVFITSSIRGVVGASSVDDHDFGGVGPVTRHIIELYAAHLHGAGA